MNEAILSPIDARFGRRLLDFRITRRQYRHEAIFGDAASHF